MKIQTRLLGTKKWEFVESVPNLEEAEIVINTYSPLSMYENHEWKVIKEDSQ